MTALQEQSLGLTRCMVQEGLKWLLGQLMRECELMCSLKTCFAIALSKYKEILCILRNVLAYQS